MNPICLITPPSCFLLDERVFSALGVLRVAASLESAGHSVEHVDLSGIENYEQAITSHAKQTTATVFGITSTSPQMPATCKVVNAMRIARPDAKIILGGPHITLVNAARKRELRFKIEDGRAARAFNRLADTFDGLVAGDGEDAIFQAIAPQAEKLVDADDPKVSLFLTNERLNELPWPARHLIDMDSYHYTIDGELACHLLLQMGCPYGCRFCGGRESPMLRRVRTRTNDNALAEVLYLHERYGFRGFNFFDDELNVSKSMVDLMHKLADAQRERGVEFRLRGFIKSNLFNEQQAEAMHKAGFRWILIGFESGSPRILSNIRKMATREQNTRCMEIARKYGLKVKALMSLGHAAESEETIQQTKDWLIEQRPDDFDATVISCYAGTSYFDEAIETSPGVWTYTCPENGDRLHSYEVDFTQDSCHYKGKLGDYRSFVFTDYLTAEQLVKLRDDLESDVREKLGVPFNSGQPGIRFEASMGMLPGHILRRTS